MAIRFSILVSAFAALLSCPVTAVDVIADLAKDEALKTAPTYLKRLELLPKDSDWVYDFSTNPLYTWSPGSVVNANAATFPAATGLGLTVALLNLGPCAILPPHLHPRATNFVVAINGTTDTYMIEENGARVVHTVLTNNKLTIFPAGSVHTMANRECTNTQLVSALNSDDSGTQNLGNSLFSLPYGILQAAFGYHEFDINGTKASIPAVGTGSVPGIQACRARCRAKGYYV